MLAKIKPMTTNFHVTSILSTSEIFHQSGIYKSHFIGVGTGGFFFLLVKILMISLATSTPRFQFSSDATAFKDQMFYVFWHVAINTIPINGITKRQICGQQAVK